MLAVDSQYSRGNENNADPSGKVPGIDQEVAEIHINGVDRVLNRFDKRAVLCSGLAESLFCFLFVPECILCFLLFPVEGAEGKEEDDNRNNAREKDGQSV